jgi:hypothetical protein
MTRTAPAELGGPFKPIPTPGPAIAQATQHRVYRGIGQIVGALACFAVKQAKPMSCATR